MCEQVCEILPGDTAAAFAALRELRPDLPGTPDRFASYVDTVLRIEGYRLAGAFDTDPSALSVIGFRQLTTLAWGRIIYVDDLSTRSAARRRGLGQLLLAWVEDEARRLGCDGLHLDSGLGPTRTDAHRRYFRSGLQISAFHFSRQIRVNQPVD